LHKSKLDDLIIIPNFNREYPHLDKADSVVKLGLSDSITDVMIQDLINSRYGTILGYRYQLIFTVVMSNGDISIMILK
jgi:hypothetical protein